MNEAVIPTKGNLISFRKSLSLAKLGYELLDRKKNILVREMMSLIDDANKLNSQIDGTFARAYDALQKANITLGLNYGLAESIPIEKSVSVNSRSVMGTTIPIVELESKEISFPGYGLFNTDSNFDIAYVSFNKAKQLTADLAEIENSVYKLAIAIKKTTKRTNALKNIVIPKYESDVKLISSALEEKEREEFSRQKVIKRLKSN